VANKPAPIAAAKAINVSSVNVQSIACPLWLVRNRKRVEFFCTLQSGNKLPRYVPALAAIGALSRNSREAESGTKSIVWSLTSPFKNLEFYSRERDRSDALFL
jgi:hypothetical protein